MRDNPKQPALHPFAADVQSHLARLVTFNGPGVAAVSGGADSVAMLRALAEVLPAGGLVVAHLNHRLRGAESDADADFVAALLPTRPYRTEAVDVAAVAAEGENMEAAARRLRYAFLTRVAAETGAAWVATAHTLDDQAETVLHRLVRGAGLRGLRGIAVARDLAPGIRLIRPLLTVSRAAIVGYLDAIGQSWREDTSNRDTAFTRNRIRHDLLPLLRTFNPGVALALSRTAEQAGEAFAAIEAEAAELLARAERPRAGRCCILDRAALATTRPLVVREAFHLLWQREGWPCGGMTHAHWSTAAAVACDSVPAADLPDGLRIVAAGRVVRVGPH